MSGFNNASSVAQAFSAAATLPPQKSKRRYTPPFSLRLTLDERKKLDEMAGSLPLASFIHNRLFSEQVEKRRPVKKPAPDSAMLALLLSELGRSRLASILTNWPKPLIWEHWI